MALETASFVANLVATNPDGGDARSTADDHLRLIKASLVRTFPKLDGAVSLSAVQYMFLNDVSASMQAQLNTLRDGSATANNAIASRFANSASLATLATTALTANSASYAALAGFATVATFAHSACVAAVATLANYATEAGNADTADTAGSASTATIATFATSCTSASSAALLGGFLPSQSETANTIAQRGPNGDLHARYMRQSSGVDNQSVGHVAAMTNLDGFWRPTTLAHLGPYLDARNISTKTGITKTLAAGSGPPSLVGSTNGDIFYYY